MKHILPIASASIVDGLIFGILAKQTGLGVLEVLLLNMTSSQFAAIGFITQGVVGWPMILSTTLLNVRQMLYGLSLGPALRNVSTGKLMMMAWMLNDEMYALKSAYVAKGNKASLPYYFGAGALDYVIWNVSTLVGLYFGTFISNPEEYGLDFAFVATFLGFLATSIVSRFYAVVALVSGAAACMGYYIGGTTLAVVFGTISAVIVGVMHRE
ncbi:AzlC family ABC transporter permease [Bacillus cereus group sp. BfR-BA-01380]|uniref:AzlC family ABC transporter permease n=1 Tax=Bacillus cereus group sp. BfR-BA-01380 TaxID=2920324 RepID=UPI001F5614A1|nr:AzlC family ABC transporter permease [Bacillus cereus group sp. BfR-BA-01380]